MSPSDHVVFDGRHRFTLKQTMVGSGGVLSFFQTMVTIWLEFLLTGSSVRPALPFARAQLLVPMCSSREVDSLS